MDPLDRQVLQVIQDSTRQIGELLERYELRQAVRTMMDLARFANKYFNDQEPWKSRRENPEKCATTLFLCLELTRALAILMSPFIPFTAQRIWRILNLIGEVEKQNWDIFSQTPLKPGHILGRAQILFPKIADEAIAAEIAKLENSVSDQAVTPESTEILQKTEEQLMEFITYEDFKKLELRVAKILSVERIEKADKLLRIQIDLGTETRQIVAGIARSYSPEELVGKSIAVIANLEPAVIRGVESNGMLLAASVEDNISLLTLDRELAAGAKIK